MDFLTRLAEKNLGQGDLAKPLISSQFESERHNMINSFADILHKNEMEADKDGISAEFYDQPLISNHKNTIQNGKALEPKSFGDQPLPVITKYDFDPLVKSKEDRSSQKSIEAKNKSNETYLIPKPNSRDFSTSKKILTITSSITSS